MMLPTPSPFRPQAAPLAPAKFRDPGWTAAGAPRAQIALGTLRTLWFNTGTLCNITCATCYIESSPTNDALAYLTEADVLFYLDELQADGWSTEEIGITGGEPFMNREILAICEASLARGFRTLVLTNAMRPMRRFEPGLLALRDRYGDRLTLRVSLDHHTQAVHDAERGPGAWDAALDGVGWLARSGLRLAVAGRRLAGETDAACRDGYRALFARLGVALEVDDPERLVVFPQMDAGADTPEITEACWSILGKSPESVMCASSRMVVRRRAEPGPRVVACTLLPFDPSFDLGATLADARRPVSLNHPHCARFCVLGGASCSG